MIEYPRFKHIGIVLGTKSTMQDGLYYKELLLRGIESIIPEESVCSLIERLRRQ